MQIVRNTTGMPAGLTVAADRDGHDVCVVVVKGTYLMAEDGSARLAPQQAPLVYVDEHYGDPETSPIRFECDFAPQKPSAETIVVGKAVAPQGRPVRRLAVELEIEGRTKSLTVVGDRVWELHGVDLRPSAPEPFTELPLTFDRAFGGEDDVDGSAVVEVERRNLAGVGFVHAQRPPEAMVGRALPNIESSDHEMKSPVDRPEPVGVGVVGRAALQRVQHAGTYDDDWRENRCPYLPRDFDAKYFMSAPEDQWSPHFAGGELIRCRNMATRPLVEYCLPSVEVPVEFRFVDRTHTTDALLDTVILEPHEARAMLLWRASVKLGKKLNKLREINVGPRPESDPPGLIGYRNGKPHFRGLDAAIRWLASQRRVG